jgi:hypothetical protein
MPAHRPGPQWTLGVRRLVGAAMGDRNLNWANGIRTWANRRRRIRIARPWRGSRGGTAIVFGAAARVAQLSVGGENFSQLGVANNC